ncbi:MAG: hypothetical protein WCJ55_15375 [Chloroflexales bacterium]
MELDANGKFLFPSATYQQNCTLLCVDVAFIPFFRLFFAEMQERWRWSTREDWWRSYQVFAEMEEMLMSGCVQQLVEGQNRLYRLLDTALNGVVYTATTDPATQITTITPDQPVVPANTVGVAPGLRRQLLDMQGIINAGWFNIGGQPATLADVVNALRVGSDGQKQNILDTLGNILAAGANAASIFQLVESLFADTADTVGEGAVVVTLIASSMANAAMLGTMAAQIDRLVTSLDGGGLTGPADNVLLALRGITEAGETRNVIDAIAADTATVNDTLSVIADNTLNTADNAVAIAASVATIDGNISAIADNTSNTAANTSNMDSSIPAIATTLSNMDNNVFNIATNTLNTADNTGAIAASVANIDPNISAIAVSAAQIDGNIAYVSSNTGTTASDAALLVSLLTDVRTLLA